MKNLKRSIMKKIFYTTTVVLAATLILTSCKDNNRLASGAAQVTPVPTSEYAQFKEWQQQQQENTRYSTPVHKTTRPVVIHKTYVINRTTPPVQPARKKGWSKAAKGGVIGAGTGAAAGALLVKNNRALGAVIGGIVGGGVGYEIGHSQDKKDGRY
jgi:hypothetical protein